MGFEFKSFLFSLILGFSSLAFGFSAGQCFDLFSSEASVATADENTSMARFQIALNKKDPRDYTVVEQTWAQKIGKPIFWVKNVFNMNKETHQTLYVSADQAFVVSKSSENIFRIFSADGKMQTELQFPHGIGAAREEVMGTFTDHVVVGIEDEASLARDSMYHLSGFYPHKLLLYNLHGELLDTFYSEGRIKGSEVSADGSHWYNADQFGVYATVLATSAKVDVDLFGVMSQTLKVGDGVVSSMKLARDAKKMYVGISDRKGHVAAIAVLNVDAFPRAELLQYYPVNAARIYRIDETASTLRLLIKDATGSDALGQIILPL